MPEIPGEHGVSDSNPESDPLAARRKKSPPVDKTMLEVELQEAAPGLPESKSAEAGKDSLDERRKKAPPVDKTRLDMDALLDMASKTVAEKDEKLREELDARPAEPAKPIQPIEKFRPATSCKSSWDKMTGSETVRFCEQCKLQVYDFSKTELPEAEEIIFKREGKKDFILHRRTDGKFLTTDCPVGVKNKQLLMVAGMVAALLVVGCMIVLGSVQQAPSGTKNVTVTKENAQKQETEQASAVEKSSNGWVTITAPEGGSTTQTPSNSNFSTPAMLAPGQTNPALVPPNPADYPSQMATPSNAPMNPGQTPYIAEPAQQITTPPPSTQNGSGQSAMPGNAPAVSAPVTPAQTPLAEPSTAPGSVPVQTSVPSAQDSGSTQPAQQPGVWQRPRK